MAKEVDAIKAKETILKLFKQKNLESERMNILISLVSSMAEPIEEKVSVKYEDLKRELDHYRKAAGTVIKEHVKKLMEEEKEIK